MGGALSYRELTGEVIREHILSAEELERVTYEGVRRLCERALKKRDTTYGVQRAMPSEYDRDDEGQRRWKQAELFSKEEAFAYFKAESHRVGVHFSKLVRLHDWILDRFGEAPEVPEYSRERMAELRYDDEDEGEEE